MSSNELAKDPLLGLPTEPESASLSADFYLETRPHLQLVDENYVPPRDEIVDVLLDLGISYDREVPLGAVIALNQYMGALIDHEDDRHYRNLKAVYWSDRYRGELDIDDSDLTYEQHSTAVLSRLYLSTMSSLGHLGMFVETNRWMRPRSEESEESKTRYLAARKVYQQDVDQLFEHFEHLPGEELIEILRDVSNMTRMTLNRLDFVDAQTDDHTHVFVGSVLSERLVKISMQEFIDPQVRYGDETEDKSPTQADVVWPRPNGDYYIQVKMKWTKPTNLKVKQKKKPKPIHVIVPLVDLRGGLTEEEHAKIAEIVTDTAERQERERKWEEAYALSGLKRQIAICRIPIEEFRIWWTEMRQIIKEEKEALRTDLDKVKYQIKA